MRWSELTFKPWIASDSSVELLPAQRRSGGAFSALGTGPAGRRAEAGDPPGLAGELQVVWGREGLAANSTEWASRGPVNLKRLMQEEGLQGVIRGRHRALGEQPGRFLEQRPGRVGDRAFQDGDDPVAGAVALARGHPVRHPRMGLVVRLPAPPRAHRTRAIG